MVWLIWGVILPACVVVAWQICQPFVTFVDEMREDRARCRFRREREWLEVRFLGALAKVDPLARIRWDDAHWHDEVVWARDRKTHRLLALIGVHYGGPLDPEDLHHATAVFEYRRGQWRADGRRLEETRPDQAVRQHARFEPLARPDRRS